MRIKITKLDALFSKYIKLRDKVCQRCGGSGGLQTSHFWGRVRRSVRWDEDNCCLLCFGCHQYFHSNPEEHRQFFLERLGQVGYDMLEYRAHRRGDLDLRLLEIYLTQKVKGM